MQYFGFDRPSFALRTLGFGDNFDPLELFKDGKQGVWYDPSDKSTLFQDVAGTVPVTKDGDPVGLMLDKSGNGNHAKQTVSTARPIYKTDGILHWLESDGVDDELTSTTQGFITERILISMGFEITQYGGALAPSHLLGLHQSGVTYSRLGFRASSANSTYVQGVSRIRSGNFLRGSEVTALLGTRYVGTMKQTQGQITTTLNNATGTAAVDPLLKDPELANFKLFFSNQLAPCKFFGGIILLEPPSDADISSINTYLAAKSGVTL